MPPPAPRQIWEETFDEGERRMERRLPGQASTGLLGGFDVLIALTVVVTLTGAVSTVADEELAHAIGALSFGIAFVFLTIGRSELFTENFLVPVGAFLAGRGSARLLVRMWAWTLVFNFAGVTALAAMVTVPGVLPDSALVAAGSLGETFATRPLGEALASAIVAGAAITLYTWLTVAARMEITRVVIAMLIGFVLLLPALNHAVVGLGELMLAVFSGEIEPGLGDVLVRTLIAVVGNTIGGIGFITVTRLVQVHGDARSEDTEAADSPDDPSH